MFPCRILQLQRYLSLIIQPLRLQLGYHQYLLLQYRFHRLDCMSRPMLGIHIRRQWCNLCSRHYRQNYHRRILHSHMYHYLARCKDLQLEDHYLALHHHKEQRPLSSIWCCMCNKLHPCNPRKFPRVTGMLSPVYWYLMNLFSIHRHYLLLGLGLQCNHTLQKQ